jgi:tetratricopeptide (TPR) repeat protein
LKEPKTLDQKIAEYTAAIQADPSDSWTYYCRGKAYIKKGSYELALADLGEALRLNPDLAEAQMEKGNAYFAMGDGKKGILEFQEAVKNENYIKRLDEDLELRKSMGLV